MELTAAVYQDELVARCQRGDVAGFEKLYNLYARAMFNTSLRIVNNRADAEDVLQESFSAAFRYLADFDHSSTFGAWLKRIVINKSLNSLRKHKTEIIDIDQAIIPDAGEEMSYEEDDIEMQVETIKAAVQQLPNGYRTILSLHLFEGMQYDEIASILNITPSTVRTQYHRARLKLLHTLKKGGSDE